MKSEWVEPVADISLFNAEPLMTSGAITTPDQELETTSLQ